MYAKVGIRLWARALAASMLLAASILTASILTTPALGALHPLDGLDQSEIDTAVAVLRAQGLIRGDTLVIALGLEEPEKEMVRNWTRGKPFPRRARALLHGAEAGTVEAVVDLETDAVLTTTRHEDGQPSIVLAEIMTAMGIALSDERMLNGLAQRGIDDPSQLFCAPRTVGNFGAAAEQSRRLVKVDCFDLREHPGNGFATPIEGLFATVDLDAKEVLEVTDLGVVPLPPGRYSLAARDQPKLRSRSQIRASALRDSNLEQRGWQFSWEGWSFHLRWEARAGLVLSTVTHKQGNQPPRSILYQAHLAELFVPYQDPTEGWYFRNYLDQGDYGLGTTGSPLLPGADCPLAATFLSPWMASPDGRAEMLPNRICIFERALGEPTWRHSDVTGSLESRPEVDLVVRMIAAIGNYDYLFDWIFDAKGRITFRGGATGLDAVKGVAAQTLADPTAAADTAYGPLIAPGRAGIWHDHFFSLRLDLDIDGSNNLFVRDRLVAAPAPTDSPRRSLWHVERQPVTSEQDARLRLSYTNPANWVVLNNARKNAFGYPSGYRLRPGNNALPLVDPADPPLSRAQFANYHLWITAFDPAERYAAGDRPNQSTPGRGLPEFVADDESLDGADLVLWYTMGFHHVPSAEDWPVYNVAWNQFTLTPFNFFDSNPALDLPALGSGR